MMKRLQRYFCLFMGVLLVGSRYADAVFAQENGGTNTNNVDNFFAQTTEKATDFRSVFTFDRDRAFIGGGGRGLSPQKGNFIIVYDKMQNPLNPFSLYALMQTNQNTMTDRSAYSVSSINMWRGAHPDSGFLISRAGGGEMNNISSGTNDMGATSYACMFSYTGGAIMIDGVSEDISARSLSGILALSKKDACAVGDGVIQFFRGAKSDKKWLKILANGAENAMANSPRRARTGATGTFDEATKTDTIQLKAFPKMILNALAGGAANRMNPASTCDTIWVAGDKGTLLCVVYQHAQLQSISGGANGTSMAPSTDVSYQDCSTGTSTSTTCTMGAAKICIAKMKVNGSGANENFKSIDVKGDMIVIASDSNVYRSTNRGASFTKDSFKLKDTAQRGGVNCWQSKSNSVLMNLISFPMAPKKTEREFKAIVLMSANRGLVVGHSRESNNAMAAFEYWANKYEHPDSICNTCGVKKPQNFKLNQPTPAQWEWSCDVNSRMTTMPTQTKDWYAASFLDTGFGWIVGKNRAIVRVAPDLDVSCEDRIDLKKTGALPANEYYPQYKQVGQTDGTDKKTPLALVTMCSAEIVRCGGSDEKARLAELICESSTPGCALRNNGVNAPCLLPLPPVQPPNNNQYENVWAQVLVNNSVHWRLLYRPARFEVQAIMYNSNILPNYSNTQYRPSVSTFHLHNLKVKESNNWKQNSVCYFVPHPPPPASPTDTIYPYRTGSSTSLYETLKMSITYGPVSSNIIDRNVDNSGPFKLRITALIPNFSLSPYIEPLVFSKGYYGWGLDTLFVVQPGLKPYLLPHTVETRTVMVGDVSTPYQAFSPTNKLDFKVRNAYQTYDTSFYVFTNAAYHIWSDLDIYKVQIDSLKKDHTKDPNMKTASQSDLKVIDTPLFRNYNKYKNYGEYNRAHIGIYATKNYIDTDLPSNDTMMVQAHGPCFDPKMKPSEADKKLYPLSDSNCYNQRQKVVLVRDPLHYRLAYPQNAAYTDFKSVPKYKGAPLTGNNTGSTLNPNYDFFSGRGANSEGRKIGPIRFSASGYAIDAQGELLKDGHLLKMETDTRYDYTLKTLYQKTVTLTPPTTTADDVDTNRVHLHFRKTTSGTMGNRDTLTFKTMPPPPPPPHKWDELPVSSFDKGDGDNKIKEEITELLVQILLRKSNYSAMPRQDTLLYEVKGYSRHGILQARTMRAQEMVKIKKCITDLGTAAIPPPNPATCTEEVLQNCKNGTAVAARSSGATDNGQKAACLQFKLDSIRKAPLPVPEETRSIRSIVLDQEGAQLYVANTGNKPKLAGNMRNENSPIKHKGDTVHLHYYSEKTLKTGEAAKNTFAADEAEQVKEKRAIRFNRDSVFVKSSVKWYIKTRRCTTSADANVKADAYGQGFGLWYDTLSSPYMKHVQCPAKSPGSGLSKGITTDDPFVVDNPAKNNPKISNFDSGGVLGHGIGLNDFPKQFMDTLAKRTEGINVGKPIWEDYSRQSGKSPASLHYGTVDFTLAGDDFPRIVFRALKSNMGAAPRRDSIEVCVLGDAVCKTVYVVQDVPHIAVRMRPNPLRTHVTRDTALYFTHKKNHTEKDKRKEEEAVQQPTFTRDSVEISLVEGIDIEKRPFYGGMWEIYEAGCYKADMSEVLEKRTNAPDFQNKGMVTGSTKKARTATATNGLNVQQKRDKDDKDSIPLAFREADRDRYSKANGTSSTTNPAPPYIYIKDTLIFKTTACNLTNQRRNCIDSVCVIAPEFRDEHYPAASVPASKAASTTPEKRTCDYQDTFRNPGGSYCVPIKFLQDTAIIQSDITEINVPYYLDAFSDIPLTLGVNENYQIEVPDFVKIATCPGEQPTYQCVFKDPPAAGAVVSPDIDKSCVDTSSAGAPADVKKIIDSQKKITAAADKSACTVEKGEAPEYDFSNCDSKKDKYNGGTTMFSPQNPNFPETPSPPANGTNSKPFPKINKYYFKRDFMVKGAVPLLISKTKYCLQVIRRYEEETAQPKEGWLRISIPGTKGLIQKWVLLRQIPPFVGMPVSGGSGGGGTNGGNAPSGGGTAGATPRLSGVADEVWLPREKGVSVPVNFSTNTSWFASRYDKLIFDITPNSQNVAPDASSVPVDYTFQISARSNNDKQKARRDTVVLLPSDVCQTIQQKLAYRIPIKQDSFWLRVELIRGKDPAHKYPVWQSPGGHADEGKPRYIVPVIENDYLHFKVTANGPWRVSDENGGVRQFILPKNGISLNNDGEVLYLLPAAANFLSKRNGALVFYLLDNNNHIVRLSNIPLLSDGMEELLKEGSIYYEQKNYEHFNEDNIVLFPNPVQNKLYVKSINGVLSKKGFVYIYQLNGALVARRKYANGIIDFDFSTLPQGVYIIKVFDGTVSFVGRVVKG